MISSVFDLFPPVRPKVHRFFSVPRRPPFEPRPSAASGFSRANAWWLAEMSLLAYDEPAAIGTALDGTGFRLAGPLNGSTTQGFVAEGNGVVIVAFRGTQVFLPGLRPRTSLSGFLADSLTDANAGLVAASPAQGRVHAGFFRAANDDEVVKDLKQILDGLGSDGRPLWLTGHSLGGAVAILTASRLAGRVQGVYVYGAPRVGDTDFGRNLDDRVVCFVQGRDPVPNVPPLRAKLPLLPPDGRFGMYRQIGRVVPFAPVKLGGEVMLPLLRFGAGIVDRLRSVPFPNAIDHSPLLYVRHFQRLL